jgi:hypothetical protein
MPQLAPSAATIPVITFARRLAARIDISQYPNEALRQIAEEFQATGDAADAKIAVAANAVAISMESGEYGWHEQSETFGDYFASAAIAGHQAGMLPQALRGIADNIEAEIRTGYTDASLVRLLNARIAFARRVADNVKLVPLSRALHLVAAEFKQSGTEEDAAMATAAEGIIKRIKEGSGPDVWHEWKSVLGAHLVNLVAIGAQDHEISQALHDAADTYESDLRAILIPQGALNVEIPDNG